MDKRYKIGNFIYELREAKGYTQKELGEMLGVTNKAVSKWETGAAMPRPDTIRQLAIILGCTQEELLTGQRIPREERAALPANDNSAISQDYIVESVSMRSVNRFRNYKKATLIASIILIAVAIAAMVVNDFYYGDHYLLEAPVELICLFKAQILVIGIGNIILSSALFIRDTITFEYDRAKKADYITGIVIAALVFFISVIQQSDDWLMLISVDIHSPQTIKTFFAVIKLLCIVCILLFAYLLSKESGKNDLRILP